MPIYIEAGQYGDRSGCSGTGGYVYGARPALRGKHVQFDADEWRELEASVARARWEKAVDDSVRHCGHACSPASPKLPAAAAAAPVFYAGSELTNGRISWTLV